MEIYRSRQPQKLLQELSSCSACLSSLIEKLRDKLPSSAERNFSIAALLLSHEFALWSDVCRHYNLRNKGKSRGGKKIYSSGICNYGIMMNKTRAEATAKKSFKEPGMCPEYTVLRDGRKWEKGKSILRSINYQKNKDEERNIKGAGQWRLSL